MGIEPTAGGCPATGFEDQERHQAANYSQLMGNYENKLLLRLDLQDPVGSIHEKLKS